MERKAENGFKMADTKEKKVRYPYSVYLIVANEFCERFNFYGMRTVLILYLINILNYSNASAKTLYHTFTMLVYFFPVIGAIIADSFLGKFNTIFFVSIIYAIGSIVLTMASVSPLQLPQREISVLGLFLIAVGTGGIKPCVAAFGGDQFTLPQQRKHLETYFSLFYFAINAGSFISTFLTPLLRDISCFGNESCFPVAFLVPGILMILSIVIFGIGKPFYIIKKPQGNITVQVSKCITYAVKSKIKSNEQKSHWLDHSEEKYGKQLVSDVKATLKVLTLYLPLPIFWALYDQQGSAWTLQAVRMKGDIGFYTILPDQMQVVNPFLILAFIPLFTYVVYPLLARCNFLKTPLQRMACGGFLTAVAFVISAIVSMSIESTDPVLPTKNDSQLRLYNTLNCDVNISSETLPENLQYIGKHSYYFNTKLELNQSGVLLNYGGDCLNNSAKEFNISKVSTVFAYFNKSGLVVPTEMDNIKKNKKGLPMIRTLFSEKIEVTLLGKEKSILLNSSSVALVAVHPGKYKLENWEFEFKLGGVYTILITVADAKIITCEMITVTQPNEIHVLWQLPQYIILTAAEVMFTITGLEFSYSQAPLSMKSFLQAAFLLTTAFGNLIIVLIEMITFKKASYDFLVYASLMVLDMLVFAYMASKYKYVNIKEDPSIDKYDKTQQVDHENNITRGAVSNPAFDPSDENFK